jgi:sulfopyruvate decarboxylase subunit alpha
MPSTESANRLLDALRYAGINMVASLPDGALVAVVKALEKSNDFIHVPLTREEEGTGVCTGGYLAGKRCALLIQNAGLLNSVNGLTTTALQFEIPILLLVLYAGAYNDMAFPKLGQVTEPVLDALGIRHYLLDDLAQAKKIVSGALVQAYNFKKPVAVLIHKSVL